jgi:hypothetical protein
MRIVGKYLGSRIRIGTVGLIRSQIIKGLGLGMSNMATIAANSGLV